MKFNYCIIVKIENITDEYFWQLGLKTERDRVSVWGSLAWDGIIDDRVDVKHSIRSNSLASETEAAANAEWARNRRTPSRVKHLNKLNMAHWWGVPETEVWRKQKDFSVGEHLSNTKNILCYSLLCDMNTFQEIQVYLFLSIHPASLQHTCSCNM